MIKKIILGALAAIVVVVAIFCIVVAMRPADFKIERSMTINASPDKVFEQVNDFHRWEAWSPWAKIDPAMKTTYSGSRTGRGAIYSWVGNDEVGEGNMAITNSQPNERVAIDLEFVRPFAAKNVTEFTFRPDAEKTVVTWSMVGKNNFVAKAFGLIMNIDKLVGNDFERGLAQMKTVVESRAKATN